MMNISTITLLRKCIALHCSRHIIFVRVEQRQLLAIFKIIRKQFMNSFNVHTFVKHDIDTTTCDLYNVLSFQVGSHLCISQHTGHTEATISSLTCRRHWIRQGYVDGHESSNADIETKHFTRPYTRLLQHAYQTDGTTFKFIQNLCLYQNNHILLCLDYHRQRQLYID